jgi:protein involved in polysaccharide export with SLBB domain
MSRTSAQGWVSFRLAALVLVTAGSALLVGCASSSGNIFGLGTPVNRLTDDAKYLRSAYPEPLPIPRELDKRVAMPYIVEPGDVLLVQPTNLDSPVRLPGDQTVLPDGTIQLGRYGQILVAGKAIPQIEADVRVQVEAQTKDAGPITARLVTRVSKVYYVLGEVNAPGAFPLQGRETVLDAIIAAGGLNDRGSRKFITLSRPTHADSCRVVLPICYNNIVQLGDSSTNYQIAAGDRIFVPTRGKEDCGRKEKQTCPPCNCPQYPCAAPEGGCHAGEPGNHSAPTILTPVTPTPGPSKESGSPDFALPPPTRESSKK